MHWQAEQAGAHSDRPRVESRFFPPPPEFEGCFTTFYRMELRVPEGQVISDVMAPEWASIRFFAGAAPHASLGENMLSGCRMSASGPTTLASKFTIGSTRMWGVGFLPLGWARFFNQDAHDLANKAVDGEAHAAFAPFAPLAQVLCDEAANEVEQFDALCAQMRELMKPHPDEDRILRVHRVLLDENLSKVGDFADRAELSVRSLERLCHRFFGFSPKKLLRRQRFVRSLSAFMLQGEGKWTEAMDAHYHDQAQFSREFATFMGMTPSEYAALDHPFVRSFVKARAAMLGSPAQTLDAPDN